MASAAILKPPVGLAGRSIATLCIVIAATAFYSHFPLNHDTSWLLTATRKLLGGARLYHDIVDVNPPLAFYLTAPSVWLADSLSISETLAYVIFTVSVASCALVWSGSLIWRSAHISEADRWAIFAPLLAVAFVMPLSDFGQREHLMLLFTAPYFSSVILREEGLDLSSREQGAIGLFAVFGFALKPYFYLAPVAVIAWGIWRDRRLRPAFNPANLVIAVGSIAYLMFVLLAHPIYTSEILPIGILVYNVYGTDLPTRILQPTFAAIPVAGALMVATRKQSDRVAPYLAATGGGFFLGYMAQFRGWNYHILPLASYLLVLVTWLTVRYRAVVRRSVWLGILVLVATFATLGHQLYRGVYQPSKAAAFALFVDHPGSRILVWSFNVYASFPFVNIVQGEWTSRYCAQWFIPGAIVAWHSRGCPGGAKCNKINKILNIARRTAIDDLIAYQPEVVFVDVRRDKPYLEHHFFSYRAFFGTDPRFQGAWRRYRLVGMSEGYEVWKLSSG